MTLNTYEIENDSHLNVGQKRGTILAQEKKIGTILAQEIYGIKLAQEELGQNRGMLFAEPCSMTMPSVI